MLPRRPGEPTASAWAVMLVQFPARLSQIHQLLNQLANLPSVLRLCLNMTSEPDSLRERLQQAEQRAEEEQRLHQSAEARIEQAEKIMQKT